MANNKLRKFIACLLSASMVTNIVAPALAVELNTPARPKAVSTPSIRPVHKLKGMKYMKSPVVADKSVPERVFRPRASNPTLLDDSGTLLRNVKPEVRAAWEAEAKAKSTRLARREQLQIWLAELTMGQDMEPQRALDMLITLIDKMKPSSPVYGVAVMDRGFMEFYTGRYQQATATLDDVVKKRLCVPYEKRAAFMLKCASACEGYHKVRKDAGITEPPHIDPLCGAAGLAIALRFLKRPYNKDMVSRLTPHSGFGSNMQQLKDAAKAMGLSGHGLSASSDGLKAIFKVNGSIPVIARVERDHFIAVTGANNKGVTYWCSDCGEWPGGERKLSWKQWNLMEADAFLVLSIPGSDLDHALAMMPRPSQTEFGLFASARLGQSTIAAQRIVTTLTGYGVVAWPNLLSIICTMLGQAKHCDECVVECPTFTTSATADPVNLGNGVEEYTTPHGLDVYNPIGPSVSWRPSYHSLARVVPNGFGSGWHHPYLTTVLLKRDPANNVAHAVVKMPNSAFYGASFATSNAPGNGQTLPGQVDIGYPYLVAWKNIAGIGECIEITSKSRTKYIFQPKVTSLSNPNDRRFFLTRIIDRFGNYVTLDWVNKSYIDIDLETNEHVIPAITAINDSSGQPLITMEYGANGRISSATDRYNRKVVYQVEEIGQTGGTYYAKDGLLSASVVSPSGTTNPVAEYQFGYIGNSNGFSPEQVPYLHTISTISPTGTGYSTATIDYNNTPFVSSVTDANLVKTRFLSTMGVNTTTVETLDSSNNVVGRYSVDYTVNLSWTEYRNAAGQTIVRRAFGGASPFRPSMVDVKPGTLSPSGITSTYTWDVYSNLLTSTNPKGVVTTYTRNYGNFALGELTEVQEAGKTSTKLFYNQPSGTISEIQSPIPGQVNTGNRQSTTIQYDTLGNVTSVTAPGNNMNPTKTVNLSYGGSPKIGQPLSVTSAGGKVTSYTYTTRGQVETVTDPNLNTTTMAYNIVGQTETVTLPATGSTGTGNTKTQNYYQYAGGPLTMTEIQAENGTTPRTVNYTYGKEGELLTKTGSCEPMTLTYDEKYNTKTLKDGNNNVTTYEYNLDDLPTEIRYPGYTSGNADKVLLGDYDAIGRVNTRTDGRGQVTNYEYEDELVPPGTATLGLLKQVNYVADPTQNIAMTYDNIGQVLSTTDGTGVGSATYDDLGGLKTATRTYTGLPAKTANYTYYPDGSRSQMATVAGNWDYLYDLDGRPTSMTSPAGSSSIAFDNGGRITGRTLPNGTTTDYTYNALGVLTSLVNNGPSGTHNSTFNGFTFDGVFNQLTMAASISTPSNWSGNRSWTYDSKDQLTNETSTQFTSGWNHTNAFDSAGNPTTFKNNTRTYNANNQLVTPGTNVYDGNGNPTTYNGTSVVYDVENRVTSYGTQLTHGYRADGLRAWKQNNAGVRTYFLYDGGNPIIEMDSSGNTANLNVFAPDGLIARKEGSTWTYYTFDAQGNVVHKLNSSNQPTAARLLDAWGAGVETTLPRNIDPWGYNAKWGYYYDRETSLYYCQNRMYDASTGRWLNRDPIGAAGGVNVYGYCGNGAVGRTDPSGLAGFNSATTPHGARMAGWAFSEIYGAEAATVVRTVATVVRTARTAADVYRLIGPAGDVICEPVELGDPPKWDSEPMPSPSNGSGKNKPSRMPVPHRYVLPWTVHDPLNPYQDFADAIDANNPQEETEEDCYENYYSGMMFIKKLFSSGKINIGERIKLRAKLDKLLDDCLAGAKM
ncbi:MAG: RHS repeat-associated core domain-containing protein [Fimbriimonadaceae bacterium]